MQSHSLDLNAIEIEVTSTPVHNSASIPKKTNDPDMPIALRKGTRSCTLYPISNFVFYHKLSSSYRAFTSNLSSVQIHKFVQEAQKIPICGEVVLEEEGTIKRWHLTINQKIALSNARMMGQ